MRLFERLGHGCFDLRGRNSDDRPGRRFGVSAQIGLRYVVPVAHAVFGRMGCDHAVASRVEQEPSQWVLVPASRPDLMRALLGEASLHSIKQRAVDEWWLWARADLALIDNLADVKAVTQNIEQGALGERHAAARVAV